MKVGLEYEGVILHHDKIITWNSIPEEQKKSIISLTGDPRPYDNYDCLAELRTMPYQLTENAAQDVQNILQGLLERICKYTSAYKKNGYDIAWCEKKITNDMHDDITKRMGAIERGGDDKFSGKDAKITWTLSEEGISFWKPKPVTTHLRGGGLHINISPVEDISKAALIALALHTGMKEYTNYGKSIYRKSILFRQRNIEKERVMEYMSIGFPFNTPDSLVTLSTLIKHQFHWCRAMVDTLYRIKGLVEK